MKLDGSTVYYLLAREFGDVASENITGSGLYDYPILYDETSDMGGHTVLIPGHERPDATPFMQGVLCVCLGRECARSAAEAGLAVVRMGSDVTFQHLYNYMQMLFVRFERMDARLRAFVDSHAGFRPLLDACTEATGCPFALIDDQYRGVCQSAPVKGFDLGEWEEQALAPVGEELIEPDAVDLYMASRRYRHMRSSRNVFSMPGSGGLFMKNVFADGQLVGTLVARHGGDVLSARFVRFLLSYLCDFVSEMYVRIGSFMSAFSNPDRVRIALRRVLDGDDVQGSALMTALVEDGHAPGSSYVVVRIERRFTYEGAEGYKFLARRFERSWPQAYCFEWDGGLFMLADLEAQAGRGAGDFWQVLPVSARESLSKVGVSHAFDELGRLAAACVQATAALDQGSEDDPMRWCYRFGDYALSWLIAHATSGAPPDNVCHPAVRILARHDEVHGSDLLGTLRVFVRSRYNATEGARQLFVARSTLLKRLERVIELTGIDLDDADDRLYLAFSLALWKRAAESE